MRRLMYTCAGTVPGKDGGGAAVIIVDANVYCQANIINVRTFYIAQLERTRPALPVDEAPAAALDQQIFMRCGNHIALFMNEWR